jgi:hypothetical protein
MIQDQQLLTHSQLSFSQLGKKRFTFSFYYEGGQYCVYGRLQHISTQITQDTCPTIEDDSLTLSSWMWAGAYF